MNKNPETQNIVGPPPKEKERVQREAGLKSKQEVMVEYNPEGFYLEFGNVDSLTFGDEAHSTYFFLGEDTKNLGLTKPIEDDGTGAQLRQRQEQTPKPRDDTLRQIEQPNVSIKVSSKQETQVTVKGPTHITDLEINGTRGIILNGKKYKEVTFNQESIFVKYGESSTFAPPICGPDCYPGAECGGRWCEKNDDADNDGER